MKSFPSIWLESYEMPSWRLFYSGMKGGVELSFLGVFELFPEACGNEQWSERNGSRSRIRRFSDCIAIKLQLNQRLS